MVRLVAMQVSRMERRAFKHVTIASSMLVKSASADMTASRWNIKESPIRACATSRSLISTPIGLATSASASTGRNQQDLVGEAATRGAMQPGLGESPEVHHANPEQIHAAVTARHGDGLRLARHWSIFARFSPVGKPLDVGPRLFSMLLGVASW